MKRYVVDRRSGIIAVRDTTDLFYSTSPGLSRDYSDVQAYWRGHGVDKPYPHWEIPLWKVWFAYAYCWFLNLKEHFHV